MRVDGAVYDILLSLVLLFAAWRLVVSSVPDELGSFEVPGFRQDVHLIGGGIGFASGVVGLGGGDSSCNLIVNQSPQGFFVNISIFKWCNNSNKNPFKHC